MTASDHFRAVIAYGIVALALMAVLAVATDNMAGLRLVVLTGCMAYLTQVVATLAFGEGPPFKLAAVGLWLATLVMGAIALVSLL